MSHFSKDAALLSFFVSLGGNALGASPNSAIETSKKSAEAPQASSTLGLGLELGSEGTGLTGAYKLGENSQLKGGLTYKAAYVGGSMTSFKTDLTQDFFSNPGSGISFYYGGGVQYWSYTWGEAYNGAKLSTSLLGLRLPLGTSFSFSQVPLNLYAEIAPILYPSAFSFSGSISVGARYFVI